MKNNLKLKNNDKISLIKKYYKKNPIFLELILMNYEGFDLYIIINYIKKSNCIAGYYRNGKIKKTIKRISLQK